MEVVVPQRFMHQRDGEGGRHFACAGERMRCSVWLLLDSFFFFCQGLFVFTSRMQKVLFPDFMHQVSGLLS